jgi:hypothetical protein
MLRRSQIESPAVEPLSANPSFLKIHDYGYKGKLKFAGSRFMFIHLPLPYLGNLSMLLRE